jgi:uncharacterized protein (TIGR02246 family)
MSTLRVAPLAVCLGFLAVPCSAQSALTPADVAAIRDSTNVFAKAALAKDFATVAGLYTEDAVVNPPMAPAVKGRAAIRAWLEKFPPLTEFKPSIVKVEGRGDLAYVLGNMSMTMTPAGAPAPVKDSGKYVEIRRKQADGKWLIAVDIFNSDAPPAPPLPAKK